VQDCIPCHSSKVESVYLTNNNEYLISGSRDSVFVWKLKNKNGNIGDNATKTNRSSFNNSEGSSEEEIEEKVEKNK
jgi:hypothetical protein